MKGWDVFDTLIARRCIFPHLIWDEVERRSGVLGFSRCRAALDGYSLKPPCTTLASVYQRLEKSLSISSAEASRLLQLELDVEFENAIPISENLQRVSDGDILLSDMYLPPTFIADMLKKCGLNKNVELVVSFRGKHDGTIYDKYSLTSMTGDNRWSDFEIPRTKGIRSVLVNCAQPNAFETFLCSQGATNLANSLREHRLLFPKPQDPILADVLYHQQIANIPLLLMALASIQSVCRRRNLRNVLFQSRDCFFLHLLENELKVLENSRVSSFYVFGGRRIFKTSSPDFQKYIAAFEPSQSLFIDIAGTGWSLRKLQEKLGKGLNGFWIHYMSHLKPYYWANRKDSPEEELSVTEFVFDGGKTRQDSRPWEILNTAPHPTVVDVDQDGNPQYDSASWNGSLHERIAVFSEQVMRSFVEVLKNNRPDFIRRELLELKSLEEIALKLYSSLGAESKFWKEMTQEFTSGDSRVEHELKQDLQSTSQHVEDHRKLVKENPRVAKNPFVQDYIQKLGVSAPTIEPHLYESYGQKYEDVVLVSLINSLVFQKILNVQQLTYLEIGANHPFSTSGSWLLSRTFQINGILVEPNPQLAAQLRRFRPYDQVIESAVVASDEPFVDLHLGRENEVASVSERFVESWYSSKDYVKIQVPACRINLLLQKVDRNKALILIIDVEGLDYDLLCDADLTIHRPIAIIIEPSDHFIPGNSGRIFDYMKRQGYLLIANNEINMIFLDRSLWSGRAQ